MREQATVRSLRSTVLFAAILIIAVLLIAPSAAHAYGQGANIAAASDNSYPISSDGGTLWSWGKNDGNESLGREPGGGDTLTPGPVIDAAPDVWEKISGGLWHGLAIKQGGTLWAFGGNARYQSGHTGAPSSTPNQIGGDTDWTQVSAGSEHSLALKSDNTLWSWGSDVTGTLGRTIAGSHTETLGQVSGSWKYISGGRNASYGIKTNGTMWSWGSNSQWALGRPDGSGTDVPGQVGSGTSWIEVSSGVNYALARKDDGTIWSFGSDANNSLGRDGDTSVPGQIGSANNWVTVFAGEYAGYAINSDGELWAWGYNGYGQVGDGTTTNRPLPVQAGTDTDWDSVTAGYQHAMAVKTDGTVYTWGLNTDLQLGRSAPGEGNQGDPSQVTRGGIGSIMTADAQAPQSLPVTTLQATPDASGSGWFPSNPTISLSSNKPGTTQYQWDSTSDVGWNTYSGAFAALGGTNTLYYRSIDSGTGLTEDAKSQLIRIDNVDPTDPTTVTSDTHGVGVWDDTDIVHVTWSGASDPESGIDGYSYVWDQFAETLPDDIVETSSEDATSPSLPSGDSYFHLSTCDNASNCTNTVHLGPFQIDTVNPNDPGTVTTDTHRLGYYFADEPAHVTWDAATDDASGIAGYSVLWDQNAVSTPDVTIDTSATEVTNDALPDGDNYIHLSTCDNAGNCTSTVHLGPFRIDTSPPSTPVLSAVLRDSRVAELSWTGSTDDGSGVVGYRIFNPKTGEKIDYTKGLTIDVEGLRPSGTYYYYVVAFDKSRKNSGKSNYVKVVTPAAPTGVDRIAPSTPRLYGLPIDDTHIRLRWTTSRDHNGGPVSYRVYDYATKQVVTTTTNTEYTATVTPGSYHGYYVVARDTSNNQSRPSNKVRIKTDAGGDTPASDGDPVTVAPDKKTMVTYEDVKAPGKTTVKTMPEPPALPRGIKFAGSVVQIKTTALPSGAIRIALKYDPRKVKNPRAVRLYHYEGGKWKDITIRVDYQRAIIWGQATSLSPFGPVEMGLQPVGSNWTLALAGLVLTSGSLILFKRRLSGASQQP